MLPAGPAAAEAAPAQDARTWGQRLADSTHRGAPDGLEHAQVGRRVPLGLHAGARRPGHVPAVPEAWRAALLRVHEGVRRSLRRRETARSARSRVGRVQHRLRQLRQAPVPAPRRHRRRALSDGDRQLRRQLEWQPRTRNGVFWHKLKYPWQVWLDGLYMGAPFYAEYAARFDRPGDFDDVALQFRESYARLRDPATGLLHHGWDESRLQRWSDPETGRSPGFWTRSLGWYAMALVDAYEHFPARAPGPARARRHAGRAERGAARGARRAQQALVAGARPGRPRRQLPGGLRLGDDRLRLGQGRAARDARAPLPRARAAELRRPGRGARGLGRGDRTHAAAQRLPERRASAASPYRDGTLRVLRVDRRRRRTTPTASAPSCSPARRSSRSSRPSRERAAAGTRTAWRSAAARGAASRCPLDRMRRPSWRAAAPPGAATRRARATRWRSYSG